MRDGFADSFPKKAARHCNNISKVSREKSDAIDSARFPHEEEVKKSGDDDVKDGRCPDKKNFSVGTFIRNKRMNALREQYPHLWNRYVEHLGSEREVFLSRQ